MDKNLDELLGKEISRKEFLVFVGGGIITLFGIQNLISYIVQFNRSTTEAKPTEGRHGFGSSRFGT